MVATLMPLLMLWLSFPVTPLAGGYLLDRLLGDPLWLPHPVVGFGKLIARGERMLNKGRNRALKGGAMAVSLILFTFLLSGGIMHWAYRSWLALYVLLSVIAVFYCLAGTTLVREVRQVFKATGRSLDEGRKQVSRIVGRDTSSLSGQEVRTAALETLSENLSDGIIAPLFWLMLLGVPGMMTYKMINTLDSMIGYRNERYLLFGRAAARIDDAANYLPARLTALFMILAAGKPKLWKFVRKYGRAHASPNSGYPEAALAGILDCRFGGAHDYFGETIVKPYIGENVRQLTEQDMEKAIRINRRAEAMMLIFVAWMYSMLYIILLFLASYSII